LYLELEVGDFHREDYYLAQIAAEIRRGWAQHPKKVKTSDFLLNFGLEESEEDFQQRNKKSKGFWFRALGIKGK